jgi:hypothetical protein
MIRNTSIETARMDEPLMADAADLSDGLGHSSLMLREEEIEELERQFPAVAGVAFAAARAHALAAGLSVVESRGAMLRELFPDGRRKSIKVIEPPAPAVRGSKIRIV